MREKQSWTLCFGHDLLLFFFHPFPYLLQKQEERKLEKSSIENRNKSLKLNYRAQPKTAIDGTEHTVRTRDNEFIHQILKWKPTKFKRLLKKGMSPSGNQMSGLSGKYVSASEKTRNMEEGIFFESKPKVRVAESEEEDSNFECYGRPDKKTVIVNIDEEITKKIFRQLRYYRRDWKKTKKQLVRQGRGVYY